MTYTVKQLSKLSGVSIRALRYYDEIGLLKPARYGANHYRYYEEEQLLMLQQILFYRELGFSLDDIQKTIQSDDFSKINALLSHREVLEQRLDRTKQLVITIDKTIERLKGKNAMKTEELYYGFDSTMQREHEQYLVREGIVTQEFLDECNAKVNDWDDQQKHAFIEDIEKIMKSLIAAIDNEAMPFDTEVQNLISQHYQWLERSWSPDHERYLGLTVLYQTPEFRTFFDSRDSRLLDFMIQAMKIFAEKNFASARAS